MDDEPVELGDALLAGIRRAAIHVFRAGRELATGGRAFLDELAKAFSDEDGEEGDGGPHRIPVD